MAYRRLVSVMNQLASGGDIGSIREDKLATPVNVGLPAADESGAFVDKATMLSVDGIAGGSIQIGNLVVDADQATDEPFEAGQVVYASRTLDGHYVIHGSVKS